MRLKTKTTREEKKEGEGGEKKRGKQKKHTFYLRFISLRNDRGSAFLLEFRRPRASEHEPYIHNPASSIHTREKKDDSVDL